MTKTETFCDVCGEKLEERGALMICYFRDHDSELDICPKCTGRILDEIKERQIEHSMTDDIEVDDPDDDEDAVTFYEVKDALPGACFHGEVWMRCPYCNAEWEAMGATYEYTAIGKVYKCKKCGKAMIVN